VDPKEPRSSKLAADASKTDASGEKFVPRIDYAARAAAKASTPEAFNAALNAMHRFAFEQSTEESVTSVADGQSPCAACGSLNPDANRFCAICGVPLQTQHAAPRTEPESAHTQQPGQHYYHHHYHHHYFQGDAAASAVPSVARPIAAPVAQDTGRARASSAGTGPSRAELAIKKLTQDWTLACNTKHLDDLVELYHVDAILMRPNVPPIRSTASIREFFHAALEAGLGEVELEALRTEVWGEVACETGRCKLLAPTPAGKRREERGKYVLVAVRQAGEWKIASDCWSIDLNVSPEAAVPSRK
jgi:ketosteroid isomerase-like protein